MSSAALFAWRFKGQQLYGDYILGILISVTAIVEMLVVTFFFFFATVKKILVTVTVSALKLKEIHDLLLKQLTLNE